MFEEIFSYPAVLRRHRERPQASERQDYLKFLKDRGAASGTVVMPARYCLSIAREIQQHPRDYCFKATELWRRARIESRTIWLPGSTKQDQRVHSSPSFQIRSPLLEDLKRI